MTMDTLGFKGRLDTDPRKIEPEDGLSFGDISAAAFVISVVLGKEDIQSMVGRARTEPTYEEHLVGVLDAADRVMATNPGMLGLTPEQVVAYNDTVRDITDGIFFPPQA
jgi:hypothetical protein